MPNKKTKDDLLAEKVSAEKKLEQSIAKNIWSRARPKSEPISFAILAVLSSAFGRRYSI